MVVEIRELHIKVVAGEAPTKADKRKTKKSADTNNDQEALIAACVERVLEVLERSKER